MPMVGGVICRSNLPQAPHLLRGFGSESSGEISQTRFCPLQQDMQESMPGEPIQKVMIALGKKWHDSEEKAASLEGKRKQREEIELSIAARSKKHASK
jgi:hypothetical protein